MLDLKSYVEQLNRVELDLLNNYLVNLKFVNNIDEDVLQYSLITIDRNTNVRFQAYLCVVKNGIFQFETSKINSKNTGSVYTNPNISNEICEKAIRNKITTTDTPNNLKLLDFGSGTGRFYFEALKILEVTIHKSKQK